MAARKVLVTGAAGYIASQFLPTFQRRYDTLLIDVRTRARSRWNWPFGKWNREGERVEGVVIADVGDPDRRTYARYFEGVDAVVHLSYKLAGLADGHRSGDPLDHFSDEQDNVAMAYNVFRCAYDAGVPRVVMASSNQAASWYEQAPIRERRPEMLDPYKLPLSNNFYGWGKASAEHLGFLFACGGFRRKMEVVMARIGVPRELDASLYADDPERYKQDLGGYVSPRDLTQLFVKAIEAPSIENEHGIPWQVVYAISNNTRAFWSSASARQVLGYQPEDDSEVKYADDIRKLLAGEDATGRVGPPQHVSDLA